MTKLKKEYIKRTTTGFKFYTRRPLTRRQRIDLEDIALIAGMPHGVKYPLRMIQDLLVIAKHDHVLFHEMVHGLNWEMQ